VLVMDLANGSRRARADQLRRGRRRRAVVDDDCDTWPACRLCGPSSHTGSITARVGRARSPMRRAATESPNGRPKRNDQRDVPSTPMAATAAKTEAPFSDRSRVVESPERGARVPVRRRRSGEIRAARHRPLALVLLVRLGSALEVCGDFRNAWRCGTRRSGEPLFRCSSRVSVWI
jgi:hypothetical protein